MDMKYTEQSDDDHSEVDHPQKAHLDTGHPDIDHLDKDYMDNHIETSDMINKTRKSIGTDQSLNEEKLVSTNVEAARNLGKSSDRRRTQAITVPRCTPPAKLFIRYICVPGLVAMAALGLLFGCLHWISKRKSLLSNTIIAMTK